LTDAVQKFGFDPRTSPAKPFYVGKGVGNRAWNHLLNLENTAKGRRIAEIEQAAGPSSARS
jgi:hypothetical protein